MMEKVRELWSSDVHADELQQGLSDQKNNSFGKDASTNLSSPYTNSHLGGVLGGVLGQSENTPPGEQVLAATGRPGNLIHDNTVSDPGADNPHASLDMASPQNVRHSSYGHRLNSSIGDVLSLDNSNITEGRHDRNEQGNNNVKAIDGRFPGQNLGTADARNRNRTENQPGASKVIQGQFLAIPVFPVQTFAGKSVESLAGQVQHSLNTFAKVLDQTSNHSQGNGQAPYVGYQTTMATEPLSAITKGQGLNQTKSLAIPPHTTFNLKLKKLPLGNARQQFSRKNVSNVIITPKNSTEEIGASTANSIFQSSTRPVLEVNGTAAHNSQEAIVKSNQEQPVVLCQIICGSACCPEIEEQKLPSTTAKPTVTTRNTNPTKSLTTNKSTSPQPRPNVLGAPPLPWQSRRLPEGFPQESFNMPPILLATEAPHPMPPTYIANPSKTAKPISITREENEDPVVVGQCQDSHPDCSFFVTNGLCDEPSPYKDVFNVREICMLSCGVCRRFIRQGHKLTFDLRNKAKPPEDLGFPEYSDKFL